MTGGGVPDWVAYGHGTAPQLRWSFTTDAPLVAAHWVAETGDVLAADQSGGLYRLNRLGRVVSLARSFVHLTDLVWSRTGQRGVARMGTDGLCGIGADLRREWSLVMPATVESLAIAPHGTWSAVGLTNGTTLLLDADHRAAARIETAHPLRHLVFLDATARLIGAAAFGTVGGYDLDGRTLWELAMAAHVGDLCATGAGEAIYVAAHAWGVPVFDADGVGGGRFLMDGTPHRLATSYRPARLAVGTLERHLYWIDPAGTLIWATAPPDDITRLASDPTGRVLLCGLASGRLLCLEWSG